MKKFFILLILSSLLTACGLKKPLKLQNGNKATKQVEQINEVDQFFRLN